MVGSDGKISFQNGPLFGDVQFVHFQGWNLMLEFVD